jgi:ABC-2 type transport system permease protein
VSRPAPLASAVAAQAAMELRLTARRGENVLAMVVIPAVVLAFFASVDLLPVTPGATRISTLLPGTLALAIVATGLVNLGIATAYERSYGVLKRLGGSPLGRGGLILAKLGAVLLIELALVAALVAFAAWAFGWRPGEGGSLPAVVATVGLGTAAFAGLGLAMAGALRPEATLTLANALFVVGLLFGGTLVPADALPGPLATVSAALPASALTEALRVSLGGGGDPAQPLAILAAWGLGAIALAARTFRWD